MAFCAWLTAREHQAGKLPANQRYRLPGDHEWSCAVGIGEREDAAKTPEEKNGMLAGVFPWGAQWPPPAGTGNFGGEEISSFLEPHRKAFAGHLPGYRDDYPRTAPVGSFAPNSAGLYDLDGNVREWCESLFKTSDTARILRGSAWLYHHHDSLKSSSRSGFPLAGRSDVIGFRCVIEIDGQAAPVPAPNPTHQ
jgi:formylglycine-generating enzyme required for sulfatase activity